MKNCNKFLINSWKMGNLKCTKINYSPRDSGPWGARNVFLTGCDVYAWETKNNRKPMLIYVNRTARKSTRAPPTEGIIHKRKYSIVSIRSICRFSVKRADLIGLSVHRYVDFQKTVNNNCVFRMINFLKVLYTEVSL